MLSRVSTLFWLLACLLQVQSSVADTLLHCGVATSRYAGRLFRPQKDTSLLASNSSVSLFPPATTAANKDADTYAPPPAGAAAAGVVIKAGPASSISDGLTHSSALAPASSAGWSDSNHKEASTSTPPNSTSNSGSNNAARAGDTPTSEAEAEAALAAADSLIEQLAAVDAADVSSGGYDALADFQSESGVQGLNRKGSEPLPLVIQEAHTEQE